MDSVERTRLRPMVLRTAALVLVGAAAVQAQSPTGSAAPEAPGPPGWVFTPGFAAGGAWDDNVLLRGPGHQGPGDYVSPLSPSATLEYRGRRTRFSTGYEGSFLVYHTLEELNSFDQQAHARFDRRATRRLSFFAEDQLTIAPATDLLQLAGVPFYRIGSRVNAAGGGVELIATRHLAVRGLYTLRSVAFEPAAAELTRNLRGGHEHEVLVAVTQALSPRLALGAEYDLRRARIADLPDPVTIQGGSGVATYQLAPALAVRVGAGYASLSGGLIDERRRGPTWQAGLTHTGRRAVISATYRRTYIPSFGFGGTFQNEEWQAAVRIPFAADRAYIDGSIAWHDNDPLNAGEPSLRTLWASASVGYALARWLRLEGYYRRTEQDTQRAGGRLGRHTLGFRVITARPIPLR
ncbi:MAG TPA: hypothetical protein VNI83_01470 [Vicinamibacterales bacterium]|nr:hypothetical protein [Vicinamibacterales bacterium]